jgi:hypothetical protein
MAHPISYRPSDRTRAMIDEMIDYYNSDVPGILNMSVATQYRKYQQERIMENQANADTTRYPIEIADFNSADIQVNADALGATHMREVGRGYSDGNLYNPDSLVVFYAIPDKDGSEWRVANTNGDPVWEEQDPAVFAELAEACGVTLD